VLVRTDAEADPADLELGVLAPLERLPIARFVPDPDASLSAAFGGLTSGFLVAFDPDGSDRSSPGGSPPGAAWSAPPRGSRPSAI
jgi:hypothetical protein